MQGHAPVTPVAAFLLVTGVALSGLSYAEDITPEVSQASYGRNCRADQSGNATNFVKDYVAQNCAGKRSCSIPVQEAAASKIGDHCPGIPKDFDVTYVCDDQEKTAHVPGESTGKTAFISCSRK